MAKKQRTAKGKKYNFKAAQRQRFIDQAQHCQLYKWDSNSTVDGCFSVTGPHNAVTNNQLMEQAIQEPHSWVCAVTAFFLDERGDYYEEFITTSATDRITLNEQIEDIWEMVLELQEQAINSGNPEHYQNTHTALFLATPKRLRQLDSNEWVKQQALYRAETIWSAA